MTSKSSVENTDKPTDRQTDKCKTCGYFEQYHKDHPIISYHKDNYLMEVHCKKFIAEDDEVSISTMVKEKKGCGKRKMYDFVQDDGSDYYKCGEKNVYGEIDLCPSCLNQSPSRTETSVNPEDTKTLSDETLIIGYREGDAFKEVGKLDDSIAKLKKELTEWQCDKNYNLPLNYGDVIDEIFAERLTSQEND